MNKLVCVVELFPLLLVTPSLSFAIDMGIPTTDIGTQDHAILDTCTPYSTNGKNNETHNIIPFGSYGNATFKSVSVTHPCNIAMMSLKGDCDHNVLHILTTSNVCSDSRYQDWLLHDFNATAAVAK